jgi:hypothetical protein
LIVAFGKIVSFLQRKARIFAEMVHNFAKFIYHTPIIVN